MRSLLAKPCVVCGAAERAPEIALGEWQVARCRGCGMRTLSPEPAEVRMEEFDDGSGYEGAFGFREALLARHRTSLAALERVVTPGRLLDVGSGPGFLLEVARERGWSAEGVEPSAFGAARAREAGFTVHEGMLEDLSLPAGAYDAIALLQVVEHLPDPRPLLAACRALLRPGGALLVATPNPASALARAKREGFNYWIPPVHCAWYTPRALSRLLHGSGFDPVRRTTWSARAAGLHDGVDVVSATALGRRLPARARRVAGQAVAAIADATGLGSIVEQIAVRRDA